MGKIVIRHGRSYANLRGNPAFGQRGAELTERGWSEAEALGPILYHDYDISLAETPVASSTMTRAKQTARTAGAMILERYAVLDEIEGLTLEQIHAIRETKILPAHVLRESEKTLDNPPEEEVWFSHGLRIAGICQLLGIYNEPVTRPYPNYCEIREITL